MCFSGGGVLQHRFSGGSVLHYCSSGGGVLHSAMMCFIGSGVLQSRWCAEAGVGCAPHAVVVVCSSSGGGVLQYCYCLSSGGGVLQYCYCLSSGVQGFLTLHQSIPRLPMAVALGVGVTSSKKMR